MKRFLILIVGLVAAISSFAQSADGLFSTLVASGTDSYTITYPVLGNTSYSDKEKFIIHFTNASTGPVTLNRNNIGAKAIRDSEGTQLDAGDIVAGQRIPVSYNGTYYQVIGGSVGSSSIEWGDITGTLLNQTDLQTALNLKANLASPSLTGVPTAPTAVNGTNTTQLATTAFVNESLPDFDSLIMAAFRSFSLYNPRDYGVVADLRTVMDGAITSSDATLTSVTAAFTSADIGKTVVVYSAGAGTTQLVTTILSINSATSVEVANNASVTVSATQIWIATDDRTEWQAVVDAVESNGGGTIMEPVGKSYISGQVSIEGSMTFLGVSAEGATYDYPPTVNDPYYGPTKYSTAIYTAPNSHGFHISQVDSDSSKANVSFYRTAFVSTGHRQSSTGGAFLFVTDMAQDFKASDCSFKGGYYQVYIESAIYPKIIDNSFNGPFYISLYQRNIVRPDSNDGVIAFNDFAAGYFSGSNGGGVKEAIHIRNGGGPKIIGNKFDTQLVVFGTYNELFTYKYDIYVENPDAATSVLLIQANSFENYQPSGRAIYVNLTNIWRHIIVTGNEFSKQVPSSTSQPDIEMTANAANKLEYVIIENNTHHTGSNTSSAVKITNGNYVSVGFYSAVGFTTGTTLTTCTNIISSYDPVTNAFLNPVLGISKLYTSTGTGTDGSLDRTTATNALATKWALSGTNTFTGAVSNVGSTTNTLKFTFDGLTTVAGTGQGGLFSNTTAASAGVQSISPTLTVEGQGWKTNSTAGSQSVKGNWFVLPIQGAANPTASMRWGFDINGAGHTNSMTLSSAGVLSGITDFTPSGNMLSSGTPSIGSSSGAIALLSNNTSRISIASTGRILFQAAIGTPYVAKTALYTLTELDYTVEVTSGTHTQTLPTAVSAAGRIYVVTNSGSGTVTVGTTSSQTFVNVSGTPTTITLNQFETATVQSNGAAWLLISFVGTL